MLKTYKAQINKNSIQWIDEKPEELQKNNSIIAYVTILEDEKKRNVSKNSLIEFFRNSPFCDSEIDLSRDKDTGREIIL
ncbi:MAG TPA: hypothetical protein PK544_03620 [Spirochaetota bacterium]|nr:hypothetical protein [Spirochaetota bacterium]